MIVTIRRGCVGEYLRLVRSANPASYPSPIGTPEARPNWCFGTVKRDVISVPGTQYSVLGTRYSVLSTQYSESKIWPVAGFCAYRFLRPAGLTYEGG
jgi:hypothetical protein